MHAAVSKTPVVRRRIFVRHGYALMLVMLFVTLFLSLLGVAWRETASLLRELKVREERRECDAGQVAALSAGLRWFQNQETPPSSPYIRKKQIAGQWYKLTFIELESMHWTVSSEPITSEEAETLEELQEP